ncbi:hypothetical protein ACFSQU_08250 [Massilia sp. GCM10020059]|uniref:Uncharacterized protein n=1 Tax=Massilia agrisoli TaxID=2892444 RepID=A0ABS8IX01_9BURK|nr:hypothetical protein [Massilia agrisoli]MCC6072423.1 hypothetical protein [Massilia agrisoli]
MTQISLVLPFALPPPELAPDLVRALEVPTLASLITRTSSFDAVPFDGPLRMLPHELWLARAISLDASDRPALAAQAMLGYGLDPADGNWFIVHPSHIEIARSHMLMADMRTLDLDERHSRMLFDAAKPYFDEAGKPLLYGDACTWFMRADGWTGLDTSTPDSAAGMNLSDWLPRGDKSTEYRKLQNEVQMLWFQNPANSEREARGQRAINAFWPWGCASALESVPSTAPTLATRDAPGWLSSLAQVRDPALKDVLASGDGDAIFVCGTVTQAAIGADWAAWLAQMKHLEKTVFAPALAAVRDGRIKKLRLVLSHRDRHLELTTTKLAQNMFWRRPTLDRLLP